MYPIKAKSYVFSSFKRHCAIAEGKIGQKLKTLLSDGGGEYIVKHYSVFLEEIGIPHIKLCAYTPQ